MSRSHVFGEFHRFLRRIARKGVGVLYDLRRARKIIKRQILELLSENRADFADLVRIAGGNEKRCIHERRNATATAQRLSLPQKPTLEPEAQGARHSCRFNSTKETAIAFQ